MSPRQPGASDLWPYSDDSGLPRRTVSEEEWRRAAFAAYARTHNLPRSEGVRLFHAWLARRHEPIRHTCPVPLELREEPPPGV